MPSAPRLGASARCNYGNVSAFLWTTPGLPVSSKHFEDAVAFIAIVALAVALACRATTSGNTANFYDSRGRVTIRETTTGNTTAVYDVGGRNIGRPDDLTLSLEISIDHRSSSDLEVGR